MESGIQATRLAAAGAASGEEALERAVREAADGLDGAPSLVFAFPSGAAPGALESVGETASAVGAPIVGMTGNGSIGDDGALEEGCVALALDRAIAAGIGVVADVGDLRRAAGDAGARALAAAGEAPYRLLLLFLDTRTGDQADAVAGAYEAAGPSVPLAGGAGGGGDPMQLAGTHALDRAVVAVALASRNPIGVGQAHGCRPIGAPAIVTRSHERMIVELDGRPATDVYLKETGFEGLDLDDAQFEALAVTHPLAQPELNGSERIRHILGRDGSALICATRVPENAAVLFTRETPADVVATAGQAVSESLAVLGGRRARAGLLFDCAGRKRAAAGSLTHEVAGLLGAFGQDRPPVAGLFTHGEVARVRGAKGDRNHAVVVVALA